MSVDDLEAGCVWYGAFSWGKSGQTDKKFFVNLTDHLSTDGTLVLALTTSRGFRYNGESTAQCTPALSCFRIDVGQECCFDRTTWVQFHNVLDLPIASAEKLRAAGARCVHRIAEERTRAILKCALSARQLEQYRIDRVAATLKARQDAARKAREAPAGDGKKAKEEVLNRIWEEIGPDCREGEGADRHVMYEDSAGEARVCRLAELSEAEIKHLLGSARKR
jgi:hypothetical protein